MYKDFYGFKTEPFNITPDPDLFYCSEHLNEILSVLEYLLDKRRGFIVLTGDVGTGKTILCRTLLFKLPNYNTSLVLNPFLNAEEILYYICKDFGLINDNEKITNTGELYHLLTRFFVTSYKEGKNNLIIVDEAQNLSFESFEMIRQISNIELDDTKLVQILIVGQPELIEKINQNKYRQLQQRISTVLKLKPLSLTDTINYINFRVQETLYYKKFLFSNSALKLIYKITRGVPREINQLAEICLITAFLKSHKVVTKSDVKLASREYYRKFLPNRKKNRLIPIIAIFVIILLFSILYFYYLKN